MNHLNNDEKLKEETVLSNEPFKVNTEADGHLTIHPTKLDATETFHKGVSLNPKTPNPDQENLDTPSDAETSSASISSPLPSADCCNSPITDSFSAAEADTQDGSPKTPKSVFDPFAPGPEALERAPICKKVSKAPWKVTPRRLKFDDLDESLKLRNQDVDIETMSEDMMLESIHTSLLEVIVWKQTEAFLAKNPTSSMATVKKTPPDRKLTGIADTCPAAPIKMATSKLPNIDMVRRKLEF